ncbi:hypothetical protein M3Y98_00614200 [Aphelenchoides besseyi]|nr:hypothetical protein M3Y98_00614200 [Aphelenchoides besseyi]
MHHRTCYVRDPMDSHTFDEVKSGKVKCNHIRGFKSEVVKYDEKIAHWLLFEKLLSETDQTFFADRQYLKDGPTNGSVLCRYKDFFNCPNGYLQHQTHCFKVFSNQLTWTAAQNFCRKQGATLAVPHDDGTLRYLSKMAYNKNITNKSFNSLFWIGLEIPNHKTIITADKSPANHFRWLPLGHKRTLADAFKTPHTACALSSSAANTGHVGVFGYNQVINGNFHNKMAGSWYSPTQAAGIAFAFAALDLMITILGLAWNGRFFTFDNIAHWFDFAHYYFTISPIDFLGITILRVSLLLGGALGVFSNPRYAAQACSKYSNFCFAFVLLMIAFSPAKLLAFYEHPEARFAVGDWILMIWCILASIFVQGIWMSVFSRVREERYRRFNELNSVYYEGDDADYFAAMQQKEAEEDAQKRETFAMLFRLFGYMAKEWMFYSVAFTFLLLYSLSRVFAPYYTGEVVGAVFGEGASYEKLHQKVLIMGLLSLGSAIFGGFRGGFFTYSQSRVDRRIRNDLFDSLVHQEIGFFDANKTGEVVSRLNADCQTMSNTLSLYMNLFGSLIFMFTLSWRLCMVTLIAVPIIFLVSKVYGVYYDRLAEDSQQSIAKANDVAEEVLSSIRTVKSFACEKFESLRFLSFLNITLGIGGRRAIAHIGFLWTTEFLQMGILTVVLFYGGHLVIKGEISSSLLVSFLLYQFQLGENLRELGEVWNGLMQAVGSSRKVFELIDRQPEVKNDGRIAPDGRNAQIEGRIEFRNVYFAYPTRADIPVMNNLSFTVEPGQVVALVGPSGGGKSSCIAALEHFYEPLSGEVLLDGVPIRDYDHKFLHRIIALVGQEPVLYARSVEQNISYGLEDCSKTQIINASRMANSHDFITQTAEGYNTNVGEKGSQMSGGQKQRIAIARALCRNPTILLLDEATSALDSESERYVQEAIEKNLKGKTVIMIAHRLSTVEKADKIVVISGGRVVQEGKHQELINQDGGEAPDPIPVKKPSSATSPSVSSMTTRGRHIRARDSQTTNPGVAQSFLGSSIASSYL